jgi:hypothetical protein
MRVKDAEVSEEYSGRMHVEEGPSPHFAVFPNQKKGGYAISSSGHGFWKHGEAWRRRD